MQIIETFMQGKENNPMTCEDGIFLSEKLLAVIDGVTTDGSWLRDGNKSGYAAKEVLRRSLQEVVNEEQSSLQREEDWGILLLEQLDQALRNIVLLQGEKNVPLEAYPRASIILYNDVTKEIVSYGDCQCRLNGVVHSHVKKIDELNADLRAYYLEYHLMHGETLQELAENDSGRTAIEENLRMQCTFENRLGQFGYPVLNGRGIEPSMIRTYKVRKGDEVILASDGYPRLGQNLEESEAFLCQILQEDPMCFREYRATKGVKAGNVSFDDRAFCRFIV